MNAAAGWKANFDEGFDNSSSSEDNTPTSSPRAASAPEQSSVKIQEHEMDLGQENKVGETCDI